MNPRSVGEKNYLLRKYAYVILSLFGIIGFWRVEVINDRVSEESMNRSFAQCTASNETRTVVLDVVEYVIQEGSRGIDFSAVPGYDELEPELQAYLSLLGQASIDTPNSRLNDLLMFARQVLSPLDCEALMEGETSEP